MNMKTLINALVGFILFAFGAFFLYREMAVPPAHNAHVFLFAGIAILGALVVRPDPIFTVIQRAVVIAGQTNLPFIGGRRAGDPPAPPGGAS